MEQTYLIHDNGGRPYKVVINIDNQVTLYNNTTSNILTTYNPQTIFIGKSPKNEITKYGGYGPKFDGNTILLHLCDNTYVFIGRYINKFQSLFKIVEFVSCVGNNNVPYPYAVDINHNIFLLIENVVLKHNDVISKTISEYDNPYYYYYRHHYITDDISGGQFRKAIIPKFQNIKEFYIGVNQYVLSYKPFPVVYYDSWIRLNEGEFYIIDTNNEKKLLQKDEYVKIIESFGLVNSFEPLVMERIKF